MSDDDSDLDPCSIFFHQQVSVTRLELPEPFSEPSSKSFDKSFDVAGLPTVDVGVSLTN